MRPSNLNEVASSIVKGMNRSLGSSVQPTEDVTREGSRKGSPTHDDVYDMLNHISDAYSVTSKYFDGYDKEFEDLTEEELTKLAQELKSTFPEEYQDYVDNTIGSYKGSRKGYVDWDKFIGWESASNPMDVDKFMSVFKQVTGHDYDSEYGEEFDNEEEAQRILDILGSHLGSRKGSRKGEMYDWDCIDYEAIAGELEKLGEDPWGLDSDEIYDLAESKGLTPDMFTREC